MIIQVGGQPILLPHFFSYLSGIEINDYVGVRVYDCILFYQSYNSGVNGTSQKRYKLRQSCTIYLFSFLMNSCSQDIYTLMVDINISKALHMNKDF